MNLDEFALLPCVELPASEIDGKLSDSEDGSDWFSLIDLLYQAAEDQQTWDFSTTLPAVWSGILDLAAHYLKLKQLYLISAPVYTSDFVHRQYLCTAYTVFPTTVSCQDDTDELILVAERQIDDLDFSEEKDSTHSENKRIEYQLKEFADHVSLCLEMHQQLYQAYLAVQARYTLLQKIEQPLVLFDGQGMAVFTNEAAIQLMDDHSSLCIENQAVCFTDTQIQPLKALLSLSVEIGTGASNLHQLCIQGVCFSLWVLPNFNISFAVRSTCPMYCLFIEEPLRSKLTSVGLALQLQEEPEGLQVRMSEYYGLTPKEIQLAYAMYYGMSISEYADSVSRSVQTVRKQLKSLFIKMNVNDQKALVLLWWRERRESWLCEILPEYSVLIEK